MLDRLELAKVGSKVVAALCGLAAPLTLAEWGVVAGDAAPRWYQAYLVLLLAIPTTCVVASRVRRRWANRRSLRMINR